MKNLTVEEIKKVVTEIAPKYSLKKVTRFGSRATENFRKDSEEHARQLAKILETE